MTNKKITLLLDLLFELEQAMKVDSKSTARDLNIIEETQNIAEEYGRLKNN